MGIEEKSRLAVRFVINHLEEYDRLRQVFTDKLSAIHKKGHTRITIVGPRIIREFLIPIIKERDEDMALIGQCDNWQDLNEYRSDGFDVVFLFDDADESTKEIANSTGIQRNKLLSLW